MEYCFFKDICDRILATLLLIIFSPIFILITLLIYKNMGLPIFFKQSRSGYKRCLFEIIKFRTMKNDFNNNGELIDDSKRLTRLGIWLRSTSLDEIPSLINILRGEMSFVGPRPLMSEYLPLYSKKQILRHNVKPGFTGWAQINGRNSISWEKKFLLDLWYVKNMNFFLDLRIIFITIFKVFRRKDISFPKENSDNRFKG